MTRRLADALDASTARLMESAEVALSATTDELARRTRDRLPELLRELVERLRAEPGRAHITKPPRSGFDTGFHITAARLLKNAVWDAIDRDELPATPRELRVVADWFAELLERELRADVRRLSDTLDAVPDHMIVMGIDGRYRHLSRAAGEALSEVVGVTPAEMVGRSVDAVIAASPSAVRGAMRRHIEESTERALRGEVTREELLLLHGDSLRWRERHVGPLRGPDGQVDAVVMASRDIHDRKKAEARLQLLSRLGALSESMEHANLVDAMAHLVIPELADWCFVNAVENGHFERMTIAHRDAHQAPLAEELMRRPSQLHTFSVGKSALAGHATLIADIAQASEHSDLHHSEVVRRLDVRSAMVVPIIVMGAPIAIVSFMMTPESGRRFAPDDFVMAQEVVRRAAEMIENARLHQELRQSEARFRLALEHANISVFETDRELRFRWGYNSMLGRPDSGVIGKTLSEVLDTDVAREMDQLKLHVIETGEGVRGSFGAAVDGKRRHYVVRYEPLRSVSGTAGVIGATIDVTELKEAEEKAARELAFRERMMGILGHDLRNPVGAVLGLTGLLRLDEGLHDKAREQLALIEQAARRMNEMIGTLLDFTRLRFHGSLPIAVVELDLGDLLRNSIAELKAAHRDREIALSSNGALRGTWDPGRMAQLVSNLVSNAPSHGAHETPVRITLEGDDEHVVLEVSNHGPTIPAEGVPQLFEPFRQGADDGAKKRGLGLGLFIAREIAVAHGGAIDVRSANERTTFAVRLPRASAEASRTTAIGR